MRSIRRLGSLVRPASLLGCLLLAAACGGDDGPTGPGGGGGGAGPQAGDVSGDVAATDDRGGIEGARIELVGDGDSVLRETLTDAGGSFAFTGVEPGRYGVRLTLPRGFRDAGETEKSVQVDGDVSVAFEGEPVVRDTATVSPGGRDTLATGSGAFLEVDASGAASDVEVTLEEVEPDRFSGESTVARPVRFRVRPSGSGSSRLAPAARMARAAEAEGGSSVSVRLGQRTGGDPATTSFVFDVGTKDEPLRLYADATSTTYRDPETGEERAVPLTSFDAPPDADVEALMAAARANDDCGDDLRRLEPLPDDGTGDKALILVHGLQLKKDDCSDYESGEFDPVAIFDTLVEKLETDPEFDGEYRVYTFRYPTNAPVLAASDALWSEMQDRGIARPVIVAHSMGGLVGRGLMQEHGSDAVAGLITLGTPHRGTPMAELALGLEAAEDAAAVIDCLSASFARLLCAGTVLDGGYLPDTEGLRDLLPGSDLITGLMSAKADSRKVFTLGGRLASGDGIGDHKLTTELVYRAGRWFMANLEKVESDAMVPVGSATPAWTALQTVLAGHDHTEMREGEVPGNFSADGSVREQLQATLSTLAECEPPPSRPATNDFDLSGSVAREGDRTVRVTLNAITVDGSVATDLGPGNFTVVENGCVRDVSGFSTSNVGIDLVFAQDMSGSMGDAIAGVRSSVTSFAADLATRGIDVRIGSVGYSGPGTIASTPGPSSCEFLGPVQDLTDPTPFQDHVAGAWVATNGCDFPENALEAVEYAHQNISWRSGAARVYVDITDASHHTKSTDCNGRGACTDHSLSSITGLVGDASTIHAVAPGSSSTRTGSGGLDPWKLADRTGGKTLTLPSDGSVDLTRIGITEVVGEAVTFTFESASPREAIHTLRIRAEIGGQVAELAPDLVQYDRVDPSLRK